MAEESCTASMRDAKEAPPYDALQRYSTNAALTELVLACRLAMKCLKKENQRTH